MMADSHSFANEGGGRQLAGFKRNGASPLATVRDDYQTSLATYLERHRDRYFPVEAPDPRQGQTNVPKICGGAGAVRGVRVRTN
jgi:hypothetical protein